MLAKWAAHKLVGISPNVSVIKQMDMEEDSLGDEIRRWSCHLWLHATRSVYSHSTLRLLLALATWDSYGVLSIDLIAAFLNGLVEKKSTASAAS